MSGDHFLRGLLLSTALNILALAAALALSWRAKLRGRAEHALATIIIWNFLVMCPVYALGFMGQLVAGTLALVSAAWFALLLVVARGRMPIQAFARELNRGALALARLPLDAFLVTARARSVAAIGVLFTLLMLAWTLVCAYLAPSWKQWDSLWYHEPIVGFTIQNHGFAMVDLPLDNAGAQKINGYPRLGEMTQLWFVIFTDRRVIDMVGHIAAPALALAAYVLSRRYTRDAILGIVLGYTLVLMPACAKLLGSTYVDVQNAAFVLAAAHFATRPSLRVRDALIAAVCLTLAVGSKSMALVPVGVLSLVAAGRLLLLARRRPAASLSAIALGVVLIGAMTASIYVRNWAHFGNPLWPDLKYDNARWGIHWPGAYEWKQAGATTNGIDMNLPLSDFVESLYRIPGSVSGPYGQMYEYGIGVTWLVFPLAAVAAIALSLALVRHLLSLAFKMPRWRAPPETLNVVPVAVTLAAILKFSPALWGARYQIAAVGLMLALVAWVAGRAGREAFGQGVAGALTVMGIVSFLWISPRTWLSWSEAVALARLPFPLREVTPAAEISPTMPGFDGSPVTRLAGLARENELGPGAVVAIRGTYGIYMSLFWNNEFSNRVVYLPEGDDWPGRLARTNAVWAHCGTGDHACTSFLSSPDSGWELIGPLDIENHGVVFRRKRR